MANDRWIMFIFVVLITFVLWPMPLYRDYVFTNTFSSSWTVVAVVWQFFAFFAVVVYPFYDGRYKITTGVRGVWKASVPSLINVKVNLLDDVDQNLLWLWLTEINEKRKPKLRILMVCYLAVRSCIALGQEVLKRASLKLTRFIYGRSEYFAHQ
ncbi:putative Urea active transporter 1 [Seiridium cardinale]